MKVSVILCLCAGACLADAAKEQATRLMVDKLGQISMMLKSTLEDGVMKESSALSGTLKKLARGYEKPKEGRKKEKPQEKGEKKARRSRRLLTDAEDSNASTEFGSEGMYEKEISPRRKRARDSERGEPIDDYDVSSIKRKSAEDRYENEYSQDA
ncbi:uncharacterized protein NEMAJ01_1045 [Nematocida major]|uniref:uncharacterized protein n=1 Tax=Nematocida major TaxID=1912982 RepID=UPI00200761A2|nr:uncharacterized protein NEMAJ01_1045 [Nematocida major]KAH9386149.1 hypothetical protein NEMAJ01_1045 [Nematocida major]